MNPKAGNDRNPSPAGPGKENPRPIHGAPNEGLGQAAKACAAFAVEGLRTHGLDVYLDLAVVGPEGGGFDIALPIESEGPCPRCLGQGRTVGRDGDLVSRPCRRCGGSGKVAKGGSLTVTVTGPMAGRGRFRLRGKGVYRPGEARRGDLIVGLRFVAGLARLD
ncbi:MAG: hypothetical protein LBF58_10710 [Deltaproteobacteria bacterium]|nr:hypothetical protein [Deltaproteobacteria bacterium]